MIKTPNPNPQDIEMVNMQRELYFQSTLPPEGLSERVVRRRKDSN